VFRNREMEVKRQLPARPFALPPEMVFDGRAGTAQGKKGEGLMSTDPAEGQAPIGFIGLGVMGAPICHNIMTGSGRPMLVHDIGAERVQRLAEQGARPVADPAALAAECGTLFLSLPGGPEVEAVLTGSGGIAASARPGLTIVDLSTTPVGLTRRLAAELAQKGVRFADAPVARTRAAAEAGTLSIMVGGTPDLFADLRPLLAHAASEVTHCGPVGCGQVAKIMNNMVLFQTVVALSEALALGEAAGMDRALLFETLSKGSADSFALRNHGMKAMIPDSFPVDAFPTDYARKDISYALELARDLGFEAPGATLAEQRLAETSAAGFGREYFPVMARTVRRR